MQTELVIGHRANLDGTVELFQYEREIIQSPPATEDDYKNAIQAMIDAAAQSKRYADGRALDGYVTSTVPSWKAEAETFVAWRDGVWVYAYGELEKVKAGQRTQPTVEAFLAELPEIVWPD